MIHQIQNARRILSDWLGDGGNGVPLEQAQRRSDVCRRCAHNYHGAWLWSLAARIAIQSQESLRAALKRHTEGEAELGVCEQCRCYLKLKIHVPFEHIQRHTTYDEFMKLPAFCWQRQEHEQTTNK